MMQKRVFGSSFEIDDVYFGKFIAFFRILFMGKRVDAALFRFD